MIYSSSFIFLCLHIFFNNFGSATAVSCYNTSYCENGVFLPAWRPLIVNRGDDIIRATVYLLALFYTFFGVSIIADKFMSSIERITSQENEIEVTLKTGELTKIRVAVWNKTVSNLTLMALGSSAPEILLSIIEIAGKNFQAGALGPGTIVGSAAFNLFIIIGICIIVVPNGEERKIKHKPVFAITAAASVLAYVWLYLIIAVISPDRIEIWEAVVTFFLFPLIVVVAYLADKKIFFKLFGGKNVRMTQNGKSGRFSLKQTDESEADEFENLREDYIRTLQQLRKDHPSVELSTLETMATAQVFGRKSKSRAFYHMHATRLMTGGADLYRESVSKIRSSAIEDKSVSEKEVIKVQTIGFQPCHYNVMENVGKVAVKVKRTGGYMGSRVNVNYATEDGSAKAGADYRWTTGSLTFEPFQAEQTIHIEIIDDDIFEEDERFYVALSNLSVDDGKQSDGYTYEISKTNKASIMILDDDHAGVFYFESAIKDISEACGIMQVVVQRSTGARGSVRLHYRTIDGTAKAGQDYVEAAGELVFNDNETQKLLNIRILDDGQYERNEHFLIKLENPVLTDPEARLETLNEKHQLEKHDHSVRRRKSRSKSISQTSSVEMGKPKLGDSKEIKINIHESIEFKSSIDRIVKNANYSVFIGSSSWKEQFQNALTINSEVDENGIELAPSLVTYILHYLTLFWKLLFACVPPTEYFGGWLCFFASISTIGLLTALLGDLASHFGCSIGLMDQVTAITLVAVGTSLPDTFASKVAAIQDPTADSSIGNVTGSNAVNVFLGLGVGWTVASIVNWYRGQIFVVKQGDLGFSVTVFCGLACVAIFLLVLRRTKRFGGAELGGPVVTKYIFGSIFISFFFVYVTISTLKAYCVISGF